MAEYAPVQETLAPAAGPPIDPDVLEQRRKLAQALIAQAMGGEPIQSWTQGVANLAQALMGGYNVRKIKQQEAAGRASGAADTAAALEALMGGGTADLPGTEAVSTAPSADVAEYLSPGARGKASDVYQGMLKRGASPAGAASFAASMQQESGFNPQAYNPGEGAIGGIQWRGPRAAGLKAFAAAQGKPWNSLDTQMDYAVHEMKTSEAGAGQAFFNARTPEEANRALKQYIRYGDKAGPAGSAGWDFRKRLGNSQRILQMMGGGGGETAALPNVDPVSFAPSPDVAAFIGGGGQQPQLATLDDARIRTPGSETGAFNRPPPPPPDPRIPRPRPEPPTEEPPTELPDWAAAFSAANGDEGDVATGAAPRLPQPRPDPFMRAPPPPLTTPLPPSSPAVNIPIDPRLPQPRPDPFMRAPPPPLTTPLPPVQPVARAPQPRPTTPLDPAAPAPAAAPVAAPATTGSIPQPQPRRQIFREPYPGAPLSAQEFARQGQNYLTGRGSFPNQTARVAPRTMQEPVGPGMPGGAPVAGAPAQPRRGLLAALLGRGGPQAPAAPQAAPAGSPVAAGATAAPTAAPAGGMSSRVSALLANPYVSDAVKTAVLARLMPKDREGFTLSPGQKRFAPGGGVIAEGGPEPRKIQADSNGVPRYVDTGEPVFGSDAAGGKPPVKITDVAATRKEIQNLDSYKNYTNSVPKLNSLIDSYSKNTRPADLDFTYALAGIFDPQSVVRDSEQRLVNMTQALPEQLKNGITSLLTGKGQLDPETKRALWDVARNRVQQYRESLDTELKPFPEIAERWSIDPRDIMPSLPEMKDLPPVAPPDRSNNPPKRYDSQGNPAP